jgi:hypothetical protein
MANIANLAVQLTAHTGTFTNRMHAARTPVRQLASSVENAHRTMSGFFGKVAAAVGVGSFTYLMKHQASVIEHQGKFAERTGLTTREVGAYTMGARLAGIETETFEKGIGTLVRKLGELRSGLSDDSVALRAMGFDVKALSEMSTGDALRVISERIREIPNPTERAAMAVQLFGKSGASLLPFLMQGEEGLRAFEAQAQKLGLSFSAVDAQKVERANTAMAMAKMSVEGIVNQVVIQLAPAVAQVAEDLDNWLMAGDGIGSKFRGIQPVFDVLANTSRVIELSWARTKESTLGFAGDIAGGLDRSVGIGMAPLTMLGIGNGPREVIGTFFKSFQDDAAESRKNFEDLWKKPWPSESMREYWGEVDRKSSEARDKITAAAGVNGPNGELLDVRALDELQSKADAWRKRTESPEARFAAKNREIMDLYKRGMLTGPEAAKSQRAVFEDWKDESPAWKAHEERLQRAGAILERIRTPQEQYAASAKELNGLLKSGALNQDQYNRALEQAYRELEQTDSKMVEARQHMESLRNAAESTFADTRTPLEQYTKRMGELNEQLKSGLINLDTFRRAEQKAREDLGGGKAKEIMDGLRGPWDEYGGKLKEIRESAGLGLIGAGDARRAAAQAYEQLQRDTGASDVIEQNLTPLERYNREIDKLNELRQEGLLTQEQWSRAARRAGESFNQAAGEAEGYWKSVEGGRDIVPQLTALNLAGPGRSGAGPGNGLRPLGSPIPMVQIPQVNVPFTPGSVGMENGMATYGGGSALGGPDIPAFGGGGGQELNPQLSAIAQLLEQLLYETRIGQQRLATIGGLH